jgi:hypothetical protein
VRITVAHAVHLYNRTPVRQINYKTPHEMLKLQRPNVSYFRVFECRAYVFLPEEVRQNKLAPKSELMTFIGYADGVKGYLFMRLTNYVFTAVKASFVTTSNNVSELSLYSRSVLSEVLLSTVVIQV